MDPNAKIFVTGHRGMVGSALVRRLLAGGYANLVTRTHAELDLTGWCRATARRGAGSSTLTIWPMPACTCCSRATTARW